MGFLQTLRSEGYKTSIILDGNNDVRLGFQNSETLDIFDILAGNNPDLIEIIEQVKMSELPETNLNVKLTLGNRLIDILKSDEPLIVQLLDYLRAEGKWNVNKGQFKQIYENVCYEEYKEFIKQKMEIQSDNDKESQKPMEEKSEQQEQESQKEDD